VIAVVAPAGPLRDALVAQLGDEALPLAPDDPGALVSALGGVQRMVLACDDAVVAADVVAAAEMAHVYHCVTVGEVAALSGSSVRWTVVPPGDAEEVAAAAARALTAPPVSD